MTARATSIGRFRPAAGRPRRRSITVVDAGGEAVLSRRRIFILPTRHGITFAATLLLMLAGCINYNLGLGYVLTFLLGAMAVVSILHTFRNLAGLRVRAGRATPVFAGERARFSLLLHNPGELQRYSVGAGRRGQQPEYCDVAARETASLEITVPAPVRGRMALGVVTLVTQYPLALFRAWSYVDTGIECVVYPRPEQGPVPLPLVAATAGDALGRTRGTEDFFGLREHRAGDSLRHVAWKALAREQGLYTKLFSGEVADELWLDWSELGGMENEARLSRLARWVLDAEEAGLSYGLRLPGVSIAPQSGARHQARCLEALATFGMPELPQ